MDNQSKDEVIETVQGNIHEIITDLSLLQGPLEPCLFHPDAIKENKEIATALISTIQANRPVCLSLSANQIGINKQMFAYYYGFHPETDQEEFIVVINPKMVPIKSMGMRKYNESCFSYPESLESREGMHCVRRYKKVKLFFQNINGESDQRTFTGKDGVIIQHEMDHMYGIIR